MNPNIYSLTIHMVSSLDGIIAKTDNSVSWFETSDYYEKGIEINQEDAENYVKEIDCYVMGSKTYEHAMELSERYGWAYGDKPVVVVSNRNLLVNKPNIEIFSGDLTKLVNERLKPNYHNVWVVGGAMLVKEFLRLKLVHEINLSILPIILGEGLVFLDQIGLEQSLHLLDMRAYKSGIAELRYQVKIELSKN